MTTPTIDLGSRAASLRVAILDDALLSGDDADAHPIYAAWLDAELATQPGRLARLGRPVLTEEPPEPEVAVSAVSPCYTLRCAAPDCGRSFAPMHGNHRYCASCQATAQIRRQRAYRQRLAGKASS